jgi:L-ribulose-5-phosphate 3-epimerase
MLKSINAWTFPAELPPERQLAEAAAAGFDGIELTVASTGPLRFDTPLETCTALADRAAELRLRIVSLASDEFWQTNYAARDESMRRRAVDLTLRMLDQATALRADAILVVPAVVGTLGESQPRVSYAEALHYTFDTLRRLRHEAERRGVTIALENVLNRFLLSPGEAVEMIDRINSPFVGWYLDTGNVMPLGYPQDWIAMLGGRIKCVHVKDYDLARPGEAGFCPLGEGSVDWPRVVTALRQVGYQGPLTVEGPGDPVDLHRRLSNIIAGQPVIERNKSS